VAGRDRRGRLGSRKRAAEQERNEHKAGDHKGADHDRSADVYLKFDTSDTSFGPHPEEPREARRLEGWQQAS
jgi:hypothetical protein